MDEYLQARLPICKSCEMLNTDTMCCTEVARRAKTAGKLGKIFHPNGIPNPASSCPIGKYLWVPNRQIKYLQKYYTFIPDHVFKKLNGIDFSKVNCFSFAIQLVNLIRQHRPDEKLSQITRMLKRAGEEPFGWDGKDANLTVPTKK